MKQKIEYIVILLSITSLLWADTGTTKAQEVNQSLAGPQAFMVSEDYGTVRDSYFAGNDHGIIIHIQDLHCNYDAQISIYNILDELINKYGLNLVTIEGVEGRLDTAPFSTYPDEAIKEKVAKYFVELGKLNGAALAHIMQKGGFKFWGADDDSLHLDNVEAYKRSLTDKASNTAYYNNMNSILEAFKARIYPKELKGLDENIRAYQKDEMEFSEYITYLNRSMDKHGLSEEDYPNLIKLTEVLRQEQDINFVEVDTERAEYMDKLSEELDKERLSELLDKSLYFKMGKLGAVGFYTYLEQISSSNEVTPIAGYPQLCKYIVYIKLYSEIENSKLFKEIETVEKALKEKLITADIQRKIDTLSYNLEILNSLFNLKLTPETLSYYRGNRQDFMTSSYINFISENGPKYGIIYKLDPAFRNVDAELPTLESFYNLAAERDLALVKNTVNKMKQEKARVAALVSGGFHTDGITRFLKENDLSYVVITPKVNNLQSDNLYRSVLLGEKSEFDKFYEKVLKSAGYADNPERRRR